MARLTMSQPELNMGVATDLVEMGAGVVALEVPDNDSVSDRMMALKILALEFADDYLAELNRKGLLSEQENLRIVGALTKIESDPSIRLRETETLNSEKRGRVVLEVGEVGFEIDEKTPFTLIELPDRSIKEYDLPQLQNRSVADISIKPNDPLEYYRVQFSKNTKCAITYRILSGEGVFVTLGENGDVIRTRKARNDRIDVPAKTWYLNLNTGEENLVLRSVATPGFTPGRLNIRPTDYLNLSLTSSHNGLASAPS